MIRAEMENRLMAIEASIGRIEEAKQANLFRLDKDF